MQFQIFNLNYSLENLSSKNFILAILN